MSVVWALIFLLVLLTLLSGFFSTAETAFFSLSSSKIHTWRHSKDQRHRQVAWLLARSRYLLVLIFMLDNIADIFLQNASSDLFDRYEGGWLLKVGVPLFLILVFGEFFPKYLGMLWNEPLALRSASLFIFLERFFAPVQRAVTSIAEVLSRMFFFFLKQEPPLSSKEVEAAITTCEAKGILTSEEASLVSHALTFEKRSARELMTPRSEMRTVKRSEISPEHLKKLPKSSPLLVIDETTDRPIGVLSNRTILKFLTDFNSTPLSSEFFFVPETMPARRLLQEFTSRQVVMACVIDEHGSISGYIEEAELLQKLLGFSSKKTTAQQQLGRQKSVTVPGTTPLETINELFGTSIESKWYTTTLGGWLCEVLDTIPQTGTSFSFGDLLFRVLSANEKQVHYVFVQRKGGKPTS